jgi:hypothetical protein
MAKFKQIMREIFSDGSTGTLSSKRVIGGISMAVVLICTSYLVIRDGSTDVVENLLMTIFITSASLLGLPAIAGAWGKSKLSIGTPLPETPFEETPKEEAPKTETPDCDNCYYKQKATRPKRNQE